MGRIRGYSNPFGKVLLAVLLHLPLAPLPAQDRPPQTPPAQQTPPAAQQPPESIFKEPLKIEASTVVASVPPVKVLEDTVVYNAAAYQVAEDAALEDLLRKIPGLEVDGNRVTLNGRAVEKILVNGKLYFGGDVAAGLKNIQADMVDQLRAYEMPSDFARISGIDDGEEVPGFAHGRRRHVRPLPRPAQCRQDHGAGPDLADREHPQHAPRPFPLQRHDEPARDRRERRSGLPQCRRFL